MLALTYLYAKPSRIDLYKDTREAMDLGASAELNEAYLAAVGRRLRG